MRTCTGQIKFMNAEEIPLTQELSQSSWEAESLSEDETFSFSESSEESSDDIIGDEILRRRRGKSSTLP